MASQYLPSIPLLNGIVQAPFSLPLVTSHFASMAIVKSSTVDLANYVARLPSALIEEGGLGGFFDLRDELPNLIMLVCSTIFGYNLNRLN